MISEAIACFSILGSWLNASNMFCGVACTGTSEWQERKIYANYTRFLDEIQKPVCEIGDKAILGYLSYCISYLSPLRGFWCVVSRRFYKPFAPPGLAVTSEGIST